MKVKKTFAALLVAVALVVPSAANAGTLIGDSVEGEISFYGNTIMCSKNRLTVDPQFTSPATVVNTPTAEFTGTVKHWDCYTTESMDWFVDVQSNQIGYRISPYTSGCNWCCAVIDLWDLDWVGAPNDVISGYNIVQDEIGLAEDLQGHPEVAVGSHSVWAAFDPDEDGSTVPHTTIIELQTTTVSTPLLLRSIADGSWKAPSTWDHGILIPDTDIHTVVELHTVAAPRRSVGKSLSAHAGGEVVVSPDATLGIVENVGVEDGTLHIAPGGVLSVGTDATMGPGSTYICELASSGQGLIAAVNNVTLAQQSTLGLEVIENLGAPGFKQRAIITAGRTGGVHGLFANEPRGYLAYGVFYAGSQNLGTAYTVTVFQAREGDTDGDGDVDPADLAKIALNWDPAGTGRKWPEGNFDDYQDGNVDPADLALLAVNWSPAGYPLAQGTTPAARSAAVPEPATAVLLTVAGVCLLVYARRRRRAA